jgi:hypothetical protein
VLAENRAFRIKLVSPGMWHALVDQHLRELTPQEQRFARSVLVTMHDRHVGVTPKLAADLARLLLNPYAGTGDQNAWGDVHRQLVKALSARKQDSPQFRRKGSGLLLGSIPTYSILHLAMPIVEQACRRIGCCYLFCADKVKRSVQMSEYDEYAKKLSQTISELANNEDDDEFQLFLKEQAFALASLSQAPAILGHTGTPLPQVDESALRLLLHLEPDTSSSRRSSQRLPRPAVHRGQQRTPRQEEGGIDGVRSNKRVEDVDNMLLVEYMYPRPIRIDRVINTGFLTFQRESKHQRARDVLVAALMPGQVRAMLSADFVKACWFDCVMRFSLLLRQSHLHQSEFRWIEGDAFDRARRCTFFLQDLPAFRTAFETSPSAAYRHEFLTKLRWLPSYLDTRDRFNLLPGYGEKVKTARETSDRKRLEDWICSAWATQTDHLRWARRESSASRPIHSVSSRFQVDEFAYVHVMLFLPEDERDKGRTNAFNLGRLHAGLGLSNQQNQNVSITWVPRRLDDVTAWAFDARLRPDSLLFPVDPPSIDHREIAGRLEQTWFDQWIKEFARA